MAASNGRAAAQYVRSNGSKHGYGAIAPWVKNAATSLGYIAVGAVGQKSPALKAIITNNKEAVKELYANIKDFKVKDAIKNNATVSEYTSLAQEGISNILSDLKTGKFYNKERENKVSMEMMGLDDWGDFGDFGDFADFEDSGDSMPDFDDGGDVGSDTAALVASDRKSDAAMANAMDSVGAKVSAAVGQATAQSAKYIVASNEASSRALLSGQSKIFQQMSTGFLGVKASLGNIEQVIEPLHTHLQNSSVFYTKTTEQNEKIISLLEKIAENTERPKQKGSRKTRTGHGAWINEGVIDLGSMLETAKGNFGGALENIPILGDMLMANESMHMFGEGAKGNMLRQYLSSPIAYGLGFAISKVMPRNFSKALESFGKTLSGFSSMLAHRINSWKGAGGIRGFLGDLLGYDTTFNEKMDTSKYEKGRVDFDGKTRKAIIEVIPTYLSKILKALTHGNETRYDYDKGKFVNIDDIRERGEKKKESAIASVMWDMEMETGGYYTDYAKQKGKPIKIDLKDILERYTKFVVTSKRPQYIEPRKKDYKRDDAKKFGLRSLEEIIAVQQFFEYLEEHGKRDIIMRFAPEAEQQRISLTEYFENLSSDDANITFYNDSLSTQTFGNQFAAIGGGNDSAHVREVKNSSAYKNRVDALKSKGFSDTDAKAIAAKEMKVASSSEFTRAVKAETARSRAKKDSWADREIAPEEVMNTIRRIGDAGYDKKEIRKMVKLATKIAEGKATESDKITLKKSIDTAKKTVYEGNHDISFEDEMEGYDFDINNSKGFEKLLLKMKKGMASVSHYLDKPFELVTKVLEEGDKALYSIMYGKESGHEDESILGLAIKRVNDLFDKAEHKLLDGAKNLFDGLAMNLFGVKWDDFKEWTKATAKKIATNVVGVYKEWAGAAKENVKQNTSDLRRQLEINTVGRSRKYGPRSTIEGHATELEADIINGRRKLEDLSEEERKSVRTKEQIYEAVNAADYRNKNQASIVNASLSNESFFEGMGSRLRGKGSSLRRLRGGKSNLTAEERGAKIDEIAGKVKETGKNVIHMASQNGLVQEAGQEFANAVNAFANAIFPERKDDQKKKEGQLKEVMKTAFSQMGLDPSGAIAGGLLGGGLSLLSGGLINPIFGAAIGGGIGLVARSKKLQDALFGEEKDGEREGGLLSKNVTDFIFKKLPKAVPGSLAGTVAGMLIPGIPGGPVGGLILGTGLGLFSQTETFSKLMFGDESIGTRGLLGFQNEKDEIMGKIKKMLPKGLAGAMGGAIFGALTPFGLIPSIMLGGALGFASETNTFKDIIFGKETGEKDDNGNPIREGGLAGFIREKMINPVAEAIKPIANMIKTGAKDIVAAITTGITKGARAVFESIKVPIMHRLTDHLLKPLGNIGQKLLKPIGAMISAPFIGIRDFSRAARKKQIERGTADYMTAQQRKEYAEAHGMADVAARETAIMGMSDEEMRIFGDNYKTYSKQFNAASRSRSKAAKAIYRIIRNNGGVVKDEKEVEKILKGAKKEGDFLKALTKTGVSFNAETREQLLNLYRQFLEENRKYNQYKSTMQEELSNLGSKFGKEDFSESDLRHYQDLMKAELKYRGENKAERKVEDPDEVRNKILIENREKVDNRLVTIIDLLRQVVGMENMSPDKAQAKYREAYDQIKQANPNLRPDEIEKMAREKIGHVANGLISKHGGVYSVNNKIAGLLPGPTQEVELPNGGRSLLMRGRGSGILEGIKALLLGDGEGSLLGKLFSGLATAGSKMKDGALNLASKAGSFLKGNAVKFANAAKARLLRVINRDADAEMSMAGDSLDDSSQGMTKEERAAARRSAARFMVFKRQSADTHAISRKLDVIIEHVFGGGEGENKQSLLEKLFGNGTVGKSGFLGKWLGSLLPGLLVAGLGIALGSGALDGILKPYVGGSDAGTVGGKKVENVDKYVGDVLKNGTEEDAQEILDNGGVEYHNTLKPSQKFVWRLFANAIKGGDTFTGTVARMFAKSKLAKNTKLGQKYIKFVDDVTEKKKNLGRASATKLDDIITGSKLGQWVQKKMGKKDIYAYSKDVTGKKESKLGNWFNKITGKKGVDVEDFRNVATDIVDEGGDILARTGMDNVDDFATSTALSTAVKSNDNAIVEGAVRMAGNKVDDVATKGFSQSAMEAAKKKAMKGMAQYTNEIVVETTKRGLADDIAKAVPELFGKIVKFFKRKLGPEGIGAMMSTVKSIVKILSEEGVKGLAKAGAKQLKENIKAVPVVGWIAGIIDAAWEFQEGWNTAERDLRVKEATNAERCVNGITSAILALVGVIPGLGLISAFAIAVKPAITRALISAFQAFGLMKGLKERQDEFEEEYQADEAAARAAAEANGEEYVERDREEWALEKGYGKYTWTERAINGIKGGIANAKLYVKAKGGIGGALKSLPGDIGNKIKTSKAGVWAQEKAAQAKDWLGGVGQRAKELGQGINEKAGEALKVAITSGLSLTKTASDLLDMAWKGDTKGIHDYDPMSNINKDNPLAGFLKGVVIAGKIVATPMSWVGKLGQFLFGWVGPLMEKIKQVASAYQTGAASLNEVAETGDYDKFKEFDPGSAIPEDVPMASMASALIRMDKILYYPVAWIYAGGKKISEFVHNAIEGVKKVSTEYSTQVSAMGELAYAGDHEKFKAYDPKANISEDTPLSGMVGGLLGIDKLFWYPVSWVYSGSKKISETVDKLLGAAKTDDNLKESFNQMAELAAKGDIGGVWGYNIESTHEGILGGVMKGAGMVSKVFYLFEAIINKIGDVIGDIGQKVRDAGDWVKNGVGNLGDLAKEGASELASGAKKAGNWVGNKASAVGNWVGGKLDSAGRVIAADWDVFTNGAPKGGGRGGRSRLRGKGFVSQTNSRISGSSFGPSTIYDNGCAPAVMSMITGQPLGATAANAMRGGYVNSNGTSADYFSGVASDYIYTGKGSAIDRISDSISSGRPTVLLGRDSSNTSKAFSPFGPGDHYVLATGKTRSGDIIVQDPESDVPNMVYDKKILNSVRLGIPTGGRSGLARRFRGGDSMAAPKSAMNYSSGAFAASNKVQGTGINGTVTQQDAMRMEAERQATAAKPQPTNVPMTLENCRHGNLGIWSVPTVEELNEWIDRVGKNGTPFAGNGQVFLQAAQESGLDPRYIIAHAAIESGWGTSNICKTKHNYFGIGAFDDTPFASAYSFNPGLAAGIIEGAKWISKHYYHGKYGQTNLYRMRWNNNVHQYATSDTWDTSIAKIMAGGPVNELLTLDETPAEGSVTLDSTGTTTGGINYATDSRFTAPGEGGIGGEGESGESEGSALEKGKQGISDFLSAFTDAFHKAFGEAGKLLGYNTEEDEEGEGFSDSGDYGESGYGGESMAGGLTGYNADSGYGFTPAEVMNITPGKVLEVQKALVKKMQSIKGKIDYSMDGPRNPDQGSADCSSTVNWAYKNIVGEGVGNSTLAMLTQGNLTTIDQSDLPQKGGTGHGPNLNKLMPGDLVLLSRPTSDFTAGRPYRVGHVEMYMGDGKTIGHGGGKGPKERAIESDKYIMARRYTPFINAMEEESSNKVIGTGVNGTVTQQDAMRMEVERQAAAKQSTGTAALGSSSAREEKFGRGSRLFRATGSGLVDAGRYYGGASRVDDPALLNLLKIIADGVIRMSGSDTKDGLIDQIIKVLESITGVSREDLAGLGYDASQFSGAGSRTNRSHTLSAGTSALADPSRIGAEDSSASIQEMVKLLHMVAQGHT